MTDLPRRKVTPPDAPDLLQSLSPVSPPPAGPSPPRARPSRTGPFGVLDIGSSKICCLIGRVEADGALRVIGANVRASAGIRAGGIVDLEAAFHAIQGAVAGAEERAGHSLRQIVANLSCGQPESRLVNVQWPMGGRAVTEHDIRRVVGEGNRRAQIPGRDCIHVLPLMFGVDETAGVADPREMRCDQLNARLHVVDAGASAVHNLMATLDRCHLRLEELVSAPMAAGLATLVEDERQLGATVIDMGGGTTTLAVFSEGQLLHTAHLPLGGQLVTNDIAQLLSTSIAQAERLKTLYGSAQSSPDDEREMLPVSHVGEEEHVVHSVPRADVVRYLKPRLEETFERVRAQLEAVGLARGAGNRVVLTGGASQLAGVREMATRMLDRQVRLGRPTPLPGLPQSVSDPAYATAVGLLYWASGVGRRLPDLRLEDDTQPTLLRRIIKFVADRV